ncbi:MAG: cell envelope integrity protein CreD [Bacteroidales bacterium]|nr:cell envelope integrity protein CreD [Bacteroidales bacterium]
MFNPSAKLFAKISLTALIALLMLIPLEMIKSQIRDREEARKESFKDVAASWGGEQVIGGPVLSAKSEVKVLKEGKVELADVFRNIEPTLLEYEVKADTRNLHRSIYDIMVYQSAVRMSGYFLIPEEDADAKVYEVVVTVGDVRGIVGEAVIEMDGRTYRFQGSNRGRMTLPVELDAEKRKAGEAIPFSMDLIIKGSESFHVLPNGGVTQMKMQANCPTPSFSGSFLPVERTVDENGFTASWSVSRINRGNPEEAAFGVRMLQAVTQYQQTTRSVKYGILIILLVFIAGMAVEFVTRKEINLIQYVVIGLSLVLFYALLLSFSEFMSFRLAYAIAAVMTVAALTGYFRGILKHTSGYVLGGLVAIAYVLSYILLQMQTYALIAGTLLLFVLLVAIMWLTRDLTLPKISETN